MRINYTEDCKGVLIVDINGTVNTLPYFNNKDLLRLLNSCKWHEIQIINFEKKYTDYIEDEEYLEKVRSELNED